MGKKEKYYFDKWCNDHSRFDLLNRWDYEKNAFSPGELSMGSEKDVWLKCPRGIHESESHKIYPLGRLNGEHQELACRACSSFAQHVIDKYSIDYLEKIWNEDNGFTPWDISFRSKIDIKINDLDNGGVKTIVPERFFRPKGKWIPNDAAVKKEKSLGVIYPDSILYWSNKNEMTPYDYYCNSNKKVYWKCNNGKHDDYLREIAQSKIKHFECPECARLGIGLIDLVGKQYGELTVTAFDKSVDGVPYWFCHCSCGNDVSIRGSVLRKGDAKTCGGGWHYTGENNPNWKGGEKTLNQRIRSSKPYKHWRDSIIKKYGSVCYITNTVTDNPELHHIYPMSTYPEYMFEEWNTIILDKKYHNMFIYGSFHHKYGAKNNTPEQLQEYINEIRKKHGIDKPFDIYSYIDVMKLNTIDTDIEKPIINFEGGKE